MASRTSPQTETLRILVVDDDADVRQILGERLRLEGFDAAFAASGEQALVRWLAAREDRSDESEHGPFDVLIIDIQMLGLNGIEVLRLVRQIDQDVTVLMISGLGDLSRAVQSLRQGADDYISKPIKIWDLRDRITTARGRRRALAQRSDEANSNGLGWGSWIRPAASAEERDARTGVHHHRRTEAKHPATGAEATFEPTRPDSEGLGARRASESRASESRSGDPRSSYREPLGRGPKQERVLPLSDKGREKNPGAAGEEEPGTGESPAFAKGGSAAGMAPGREAPPRARSAARPGGSSFRPGGSATFASTSPLDAFLLLAGGIERQREGWRGHGARVADRARVIAESLASELRLDTTQIRGLVLAAELHGLGLVRARGQSFRDAASDPLRSPLHDSVRGFGTYEHGTAGCGEGLPASCAQGQESENLEVVARLLEALRLEHRPGSWPGAWLREARGARDDETGRILEVAESILLDVEARRLSATREERAEKDPLRGLVRIFELADFWVHLTSPGLEGLGPRLAHGRLADAFQKRGAAAGERTAFPWQRALESLESLESAS